MRLHDQHGTGGGTLGKRKTRRSPKSTKVPPGHKRLQLELPADLKRAVDTVAELAATSRAVTIQVLVTVVIEHSQLFNQHPPVIANRADCVKIECTIPKRMVSRWATESEQRALGGFSGLVRWALDAIISVTEVRELARLIHSRPDIQELLAWVRNNAR
jgi:hypothetical protein